MFWAYESPPLNAAEAKAAVDAYLPEDSTPEVDKQVAAAKTAAKGMLGAAGDKGAVFIVVIQGQTTTGNEPEEGQPLPQVGAQVRQVTRAPEPSDD